MASGAPVGGRIGGGRRGHASSEELSLGWGRQTPIRRRFVGRVGADAFAPAVHDTPRGTAQVRARKAPFPLTERVIIRACAATAIASAGLAAQGGRRTTRGKGVSGGKGRQAQTGCARASTRQDLGATKVRRLACVGARFGSGLSRRPLRPGSSGRGMVLLWEEDGDHAECADDRVHVWSDARGDGHEENRLGGWELSLI